MRGRGRISSSTIDRIKQTADILDVVREFIPELRRSGSNWVCRSPLTGEKTPSFNVVPKLNIFNDFSAQKRGDSIKFLMEYQGMSYVEALEWLAKRYNIEVEREGDREGGRVQVNHTDYRKARLYRITGWMQSKFEGWLWNRGSGSRGLDYLRLRGAEDEVIKQFGIGYAIDSFNALKDSFRSEMGGIDLSLLEEVSGIKRKDEGSGYYDFFRDRVMFPIRDVEGRVLGFTGRTLKEGGKGDTVPKYINSRESLIFKKGHTLYGLYEAKEFIRRQDEVYIVEGPMDVLGFWQAGIKNVVATNGTALTRRGVDLLMRYTRNFVIAMDGDSAGEKGIDLGLPILMRGLTSEGGRVDIVFMKDSKDPFEYVSLYGGESFRAFVEKERKDFVHARIERLWGNRSELKKSASVIKQLIYTICYIEDLILRNQYLQLLSELTGVNYADIQESYKVIQENIRMRGYNTQIDDERVLMKLLLKFGEEGLDGQTKVSEYVKRFIRGEFIAYGDMYERYCRGDFGDEGMSKLKEEHLRVEELRYRQDKSEISGVLNDIIPHLVLKMIEQSQDEGVRVKLKAVLSKFPGYG